MYSGEKGGELPDTTLAPSAERATSIEASFARFNDMAKTRKANAKVRCRN
jgi:hypothetical protein